MKIEGLDYNTQREQLILPEYGREVQSMVNYAMALPTKPERQRCAEAIIDIMRRMSAPTADVEGFERKLWDHLALMSAFQLDIDYPFDVSKASTILQRPDPMPYPMSRIPIRHYGNMMFELFEKLKTMRPGRERDTLVRMVANQMKRDLVLWGHGSSDNEKVASDLANFTDGKIQLDLDTFKFEKVEVKEVEKKRGRKNK